MAFAGTAPALLLTAAAVVLVVAFATEQPALALSIPAGLAAVLVAGLWPAVAVLIVVVVSSTVGSLVAFTPLTPFNVADMIDFALLGLWLAVAGMYLSGRGKRSPWLWPGLLAVTVYVGLTALSVPFTDPFSVGLDSFRQAAWHLLVLVLVAVAPWSAHTHRRIARGIVLVALLVGTYASWRWLTGPTQAEEDVIRAATSSKRFAVPFLSGFQLASWTSFLIPFCLAFALMSRDRWRLIAAASVPALGVAMIASHTRAGLVAAIAGVAVTFGLFLYSRAFGRRRARVVIVSLIIIAGGLAGLAFTFAGEGRQAERYSNLVSPSEDPGLVDRTEAWGDALNVMYRRPWGAGLGTVGFVSRDNPRGAVGPAHLDNSYLKVGLEQGIVLMVLFVVAFVLLLLGLARRAISIRDPDRSLLAIGACGTLTALLLLFMLGLYIEGSQVVVGWALVGLGAAQVRPSSRPD